MSLENTLQNGELPPQQDQQKLAKNQQKDSIKDLRSSSLAIHRAYTTVFSMYCSLFVVGLGTAVVANIRGFLAANPAKTVPAVLLAGLSVGSFFTVPDPI